MRHRKIRKLVVSSARVAAAPAWRQMLEYDREAFGLRFEAHWIGQRD